MWVIWKYLTLLLSIHHNSHLAKNFTNMPFPADQTLLYIFYTNITSLDYPCGYILLDQSLVSLSKASPRLTGGQGLYNSLSLYAMSLIMIVATHSLDLIILMNAIHDFIGIVKGIIPPFTHGVIRIWFSHKPFGSIPAPTRVPIYWHLNKTHNLHYTYFMYLANMHIIILFTYPYPHDHTRWLILFSLPSVNTSIYIYIFSFGNLWYLFWKQK